MTDKKRRLLLATVLVACIIAIPFGVRYITDKTKTEQAKIDTLKQAVISSQAIADGAKAQYIALKDTNIQKERSVAENAVKTLYCDVYSSDADILIGFAELCDRAKAYNARQLGKLGNGAD